MVLALEVMLELKMDTKLISELDKEKFIKLVTPNYYLEGVNSRLVKDNIIEAVDEFLSFERKPDEILFEQDYSNYERDANGNVVYKSKEQQSNNFKTQLEKDKKNYKDDFYEYFEKTKEGFKLKIENFNYDQKYFCCKR